jgi:hypothetical protein
MWLRPFRTIGLFVLCCSVLAGVVGCGKGRASVKGKVTFNNQPLTAGNIAYIASDNRIGTGIIKSDGTYEIKDAPIGETTITVTTPKTPMGPVRLQKPPPGVQGMPKEMMPPGYEPGKPVRIMPVPEKYSTVETSSLKFTIKPGSQDHDVQLTP